MSKIIVRSIARSINAQAPAVIEACEASINAATVQLNYENASQINVAEQAINNQESVMIMKGTFLAMNEAGYSSMKVLTNQGFIRIIGANMNGEAMIAELKLNNKVEVSTLTSDTLNVANCDAINNKFNHGLEKYGVRFKISQTDDSCPKPPVPVGIKDKLKKAKRHLLNQKRKIR